MIEISAYALEAAIQAVDEKIWGLKAEMEQVAESGDPSDLEDEIMGYMKAADSLRTSYEEAIKQRYSLMPYEKLVR